MDNQRLILLLVFSFSLVMLWDAWQRQEQPKPAPVAAQSKASPGKQAKARSNAIPVPTPASTSTPSTTPAPASSAAVPNVAARTASSAPKTTVVTDLYKAEISADGGSLVQLELRKELADGSRTKKFMLFHDNGKKFYQAESGLIGKDLPNHKTLFHLTGASYELKPGQKTLEVRLEAPVVDGIKVTKIYTFRRGSYLIGVSYDIVNGSKQAITPSAYFQSVHDGIPPPTHTGYDVGRSFNGGAVYTHHDKYQKFTYEDIAKGKAEFAHKADNGWIAVVQHYFLSAWLPDGKVEREFFARQLPGDLYGLGVILPVATIAPGATGKVAVRLYAGPQEQEKLADIAPGLNLVVDYGWLTVIASPLFWVLEQIYRIVGNWGWAIIVLTILLKLIFFPLSAASYKSMAKMKLITPKMSKLKEMYGSDRARLNQEMMAMYKREKINPLGGCLPIVVQIPVFIALYWVLLGSVEMRNAPWLGWIHDLSSRDPYFILPLIMGVTMLLQQKLNPKPPDPIQAKVMLFMPIVFTGMFMFSPSGLVLYWTTNNILSIAQQWQITRMLERAQKKKGT